MGDVIIVDDEGDGDYTSIKDALNHSDPGDTIEVYSGTYYEHGIDIIEERITLQGIPYELGNGSDTGKPFINGEGKDDVIDIKAKNIIITSFRIENGGGTIACGIIGVWTGANNCLISDNDISHSNMCCIACSSNNNRLANNNISHNILRPGIGLGGENNTISGNVIFDVEIGIGFWNSNHNIVTGNKISRCREFGIDIAGSNLNTVEGNTFEDNIVGVHIYISRFNTNEGNTFENNTVGVYIDKSLGSRIKNNNFINNQLQAQFFYGIPPFWVLTNRWNGNYWNSSRSLPYPIRGVYFFFPWVQFDWHPAKEPYDI